MRFSSKRNGILCNGNRNCINGQAVNINVKNLNYGISKIANNGCELVAFYNALLLCGNKREFSDILNLSNRLLFIKWLFGLFGSRPWKLYKLFIAFNQKYRIIKGDYSQSLNENKVYIISFFNYHSLTIHTVAFTCDSDKNITAYNRYSNIDSCYKYNSRDGKTGLDLMLEETGKPIIMYEITSAEIEGIM